MRDQESVNVAATRDRMLGAWEAYNEVLGYLNTLEGKSVPKKEIYAAVMAMQPKPGVGYVIVPIEPTPQQIEAATVDWQKRIKAKMSGERQIGDQAAAFRETYRAMTNPQPAAGG